MIYLAAVFGCSSIKSCGRSFILAEKFTSQPCGSFIKHLKKSSSATTIASMFKATQSPSVLKVTPFA